MKQTPVPSNSPVKELGPAGVAAPPPAGTAAPPLGAAPGAKVTGPLSVTLYVPLPPLSPYLIPLILSNTSRLRLDTLYISAI